MASAHPVLYFAGVAGPETPLNLPSHLNRPKIYPHTPSRLKHLPRTLTPHLKPTQAPTARSFLTLLQLTLTLTPRLKPTQLSTARCF